MAADGDDELRDDNEPSLQIELDTNLEEPDASEIPEAGMNTFFNEDVPSLASKLTSIEAMFKLLTSDLKFQDFMRECLLLIMKLVKSEAGSILEINHNEKTIFFRAAAGHSSDQVIRFVIPFGQGIVGHVAESRQPLLVSDEKDEKHLKSIADAVGFQVRNLVALPIIVRGEVYGVLELLNRLGAHNYTDADIDLLRSVTDTMARAIEIRMMIAWTKRKSGEDAA